jgi:hypothetical protein
MMSDTIKKNLKQTSVWKRGLYILLFAIFYGVAEVVLVAVIVFQFLLKLFTTELNRNLLVLGQNLSTYIYQILQYMTFNSDVRPYPFGEWPQGEPQPGAGQTDHKEKVLEQNGQDSDASVD